MCIRDSMMKPLQLSLQKYLGFSDIADKDKSLRSFLRMEKWIFDSPDHAGAAFRQFIKDFYQENKLIKGEVDLNGQILDLKSIMMPVLSIFLLRARLPVRRHWFGRVLVQPTY